MKKKIPSFKTDEEAEHFVDTADLSEYDLSDFKPVRLNSRRRQRSSTCACRARCWTL